MGAQEAMMQSIERSRQGGEGDNSPINVSARGILAFMDKNGR